MRFLHFKQSILAVCFLAYGVSVFAQDTVRFTCQGGASKWFGVVAPYNEEFTVNWGDGSIDTVLYTYPFDSLYYMHHAYPDSNAYTVVVAQKSVNCVFKWLDCSYAQITNLDLSQCSVLEMLDCSNNQLTYLDLSACTALKYLYCRNNHLQLSNLYNISVMGNILYMSLGTQTLPQQMLNVGDTVDFSAQAILGGINTDFDVWRSGFHAFPSDYTDSAGKIVFNYIGDYSVAMTNTTIVSDPNAKVIASFNAGGYGGIPTAMTLSHHQLTMNVGDTVPIRALFTPSNAINSYISCNASEGNISFSRTAIDAFSVYANSAGIVTFYIYWGAPTTFVDSCIITIIDTNANANSVALDAFISPTINDTLFGTTIPVVVSIRNVGTNNLHNCLLNWSINGVMQMSPMSYLNPIGLPQGVSDTVTLGSFTLLGNGTICAWVSMPNGAVDSITYDDTACVILTPFVPVAGINVNPNQLTLNIGDSMPLTASVIPYNAANQRIWCFYDDTLTNIKAWWNNSMVYGLSVGVTAIYFQTYDGGFMDSCMITVTSPSGSSLISGFVGEENNGSQSISQKSVNHPVADVNVYLQSFQNEWVTVAHTLTNAEGYFEFRNVLAGRYQVVLDIPGTEHIDNPQIIDINDGDTIKNIAYEITENGIVNKSGGVGVKQLKIENGELKIYPNPTNNQLIIENGKQIISTIEMYDVFGRLLQSKIVNLQSEIVVDVSCLEKGIYFLKVDGKRVRFVKE